MEPIEINAGGYYLRALRADDRIDDRQAIVEAFADGEIGRWASGERIGDLADAGDYVARRNREWTEDVRYSWAVADPLTGDLLGEVGLRELDLAGHTAEAACWTHPRMRGKGVAAAALGAVLRFGFSGLGLDRITYQHLEGNAGSRRVAEKCGFEFVRFRTENRGGQPVRLLVWIATPTGTGSPRVRG